MTYTHNWLSSTFKLFCAPLLRGSLSTLKELYAISAYLIEGNGTFKSLKMELSTTDKQIFFLDIYPFCTETLSCNSKKLQISNSTIHKIFILFGKACTDKRRASRYILLYNSSYKEQERFHASTPSTVHFKQRKISICKEQRMLYK